MNRPSRTTRRASLTDEGASYSETCVRILAEIDEADATISAGRVEPQGILRVAMASAFGHQHIAPLVPKFGKLYPKLQLALSLSDRRVNLIVSAAAPISRIYTGTRLEKEFERTRSRLLEMQSLEYLAAGHLQ